MQNTAGTAVDEDNPEEIVCLRTVISAVLAGFDCSRTVILCNYKAA